MNITFLIAAYGLFILIYLVYSLVGIYHLRRFGYAGDLTKTIIFIYSLLSVVIILGSFAFIFFQIIGVQ